MLRGGIFVSSHLLLEKNKCAVVDPRRGPCNINGSSSCFSSYYCHCHASVQTQPLVYLLSGQFLAKKKRPEDSVRRHHFMLQKVFKMQGFRRATIYCLRGCLFATCLQLFRKVKFQRKRSKRRSKVHSCGILDQGKLQRNASNEAFLLLQCLAYQT